MLLGLSFPEARINTKSLNAHIIFQSGETLHLCVECIVIWSWSKFFHALEMWNTAENRKPQVDSDEVLEKQNSVINGGSFTPVFILSSQPYCLGVLSYSWCTALPNLLFKDMRPWTSASSAAFFLFSAITKLAVLVPNWLALSPCHFW